jgi:hypothetical protein
LLIGRIKVVEALSLEACVLFEHRAQEGLNHQCMGRWIIMVIIGVWVAK